MTPEQIRAIIGAEYVKGEAKGYPSLVRASLAAKKISEENNSELLKSIAQLRQELQVFVHDIPRREKTIGNANMATVHQMRKLDSIIDDFKHSLSNEEGVPSNLRPQLSERGDERVVDSLVGAATVSVATSCPDWASVAAEKISEEQNRLVIRAKELLITLLESHFEDDLILVEFDDKIMPIIDKVFDSLSQPSPLVKKVKR